MATLVPDVTGTQQSLAALDSSVSSLDSYATDLVNTDLTSIVWQLIGAENPTILSAVQAEQKNAAAFLQLSIMASATATITGFAATFATQSAAMLTVLTAAGDAPLTSAQQKVLGAAMDTLVAGLQAQETVIAHKAAATKVLSDQINDPTGNLMTGETAVQGTIASFTTSMTDLENMAKVPGADPSIGMGIVAYQEAITWLQGLLSTLQGLVTANNQMGDALGGTQVIWRTLADKYQFVQSQINEAGTDPTFVAVGDVTSAQLGWAQLATYAEGLK